MLSDEKVEEELNGLRERLTEEKDYEQNENNMKKKQEDTQNK